MRFVAFYLLFTFIYLFVCFVADSFLFTFIVQVRGCASPLVDSGFGFVSAPVYVCVCVCARSVCLCMCVCARV